MCSQRAKRKQQAMTAAPALFSKVQFKKWQTCHQVLRCWPHSTICWSPGQVIGRPGLMVTSHTTHLISGTLGRVFYALSRRRLHFRFWKRTWQHPRWRSEAEIAPALWWASKNFPILLVLEQIYRLTNKMQLVWCNSWFRSCQRQWIIWKTERVLKDIH